MGFKSFFNLRLVNTGDNCTPIFDDSSLMIVLMSDVLFQDG